MKCSENGISSYCASCGKPVAAIDGESMKNFAKFNDELEMNMIEYKSTPNQRVTEDLPEPMVVILKDRYEVTGGDFVWQEQIKPSIMEGKIWNAITAVAFAVFVVFILGLVAYGLFLKA